MKVVDHPNAKLMEAVYAAFTVGDVQKAAGYWTKDCVHYYPGTSELSGAHEGIESALAFAGRMFEICQGRIQMEIHEIGASDTFAFATVFTRYEREGKSLEMPFVNVARIQDGLIAEFWTYPEDQYAVDQFWA
ncbi:MULTISPECIES: nuclear transport factor 2 family protein [Streptomycetaceae]|uniref:nuclear transport factor 2 family protein n=1 Tax=Streptomycetaceae TaxID=2062 RepID=UPI002E17248C|nr:MULTISPECIES: nuclear transport factor 2 family protein [Streptomycetaceae]MED7951247.1 nuclear transport factor 2 family protein [Streptomyces sp. BE303]MEE1826434.1 nuclear transport factor 2 family protein [Streptomyces sp. BE20]